MKSLTMKKRKEGGFVLTSELVLIVTILVLGMIVGLVTMRDALNAEMDDVAESFGAVDQSYCYDGLVNGEISAATAGSCFDDDVDDFAGDTVPQAFVPAVPTGPADAFVGPGGVPGSDGPE